jgi:hypothetical protein
MATEALIELSWRNDAPARDRWRTRALAREPLWSNTTVVLVVAAALLVSSAALHLHLWLAGYRAIPTVGPLFLVQGIATPVAAVLVLLTRCLVAVAVALATMAGTVAGFLLADTVGLFRFHDGFAAPNAWAAFLIEVGAIVLLAIGGRLIVRGSRNGPTTPAQRRSVEEMLDDAPTLAADSDRGAVAMVPSQGLPPRR